VELRRRPTDVSALLRRVAAEADVKDHPVEVVSGSVHADLDEAKGERIVENLLINGIRHTAPGTRLWVKAEEREGAVLIAVEDDGVGVAAELREVLFEPFQQGPMTHPHAPGSGIGLSLVARFADLHGGRAWVEEREGGGASFRVMLPDGRQASLGRSDSSAGSESPEPDRTRSSAAGD